VVAESRRLEDVNSCFDEVLAGHVPARPVFDLSWPVLRTVGRK